MDGVNITTVRLARQAAGMGVARRAATRAWPRGGRGRPAPGFVPRPAQMSRRGARHPGG